MPAGTHFPLGSSQGLVRKLYSQRSSEHVSQFQTCESSCGHLCSPIMPWLWCLGTCWTWSSSQNIPCVFRQAAWATMAWLPCRLKGDLTCHLWERSEYPDPTILLIVAGVLLLFLAEILHASLHFQGCFLGQAQESELDFVSCNAGQVTFVLPWTISAQFLYYTSISDWWWTVGLFSYFCSQIRSPKLEEQSGFWPIDSFTPSLKLSETIAACLSQPFKFEYTEGRVGSIFAPEDCPILCTNLVRGILNMLQITIKKSQNVYELQEVCFSLFWFYFYSHFTIQE